MFNLHPMYTVRVCAGGSECVRSLDRAHRGGSERPERTRRGRSERLAILQRLLAAGARVNGLRRSALFAAAGLLRPEAVRLLQRTGLGGTDCGQDRLRQGEPRNARPPARAGGDGCPGDLARASVDVPGLLTRAVAARRLAAVHLLVAGGPDTNTIDGRRWPLLIDTADRGDAEIVQALLGGGALVNGKTPTSVTAPIAAVLKRRVVSVERSVRRIVLHLPATFPWLPTWQRIARAVGATP